MIAISDIISLVKDYTRNQSLDSTRAIRTINSATDLVFAEMGLPSQEKEYTFSFDEGQATYTTPLDYGEPIFLRYQDDTLNGNNKFSFRPAEFLFDRIQTVGRDTRLWGHDSASGAWRLYVLGKNSKSSLTLDSFDINNSTFWTASNDALNIKDDYNTYKEGSGSLSFDITPTATHRGTLKRIVSSQDLYQYNAVGHFKVWVYLANVTNLTDVSFSWGTDVSNYFKQTVTTQQDGTALIVGWNQLDFLWSGSTQVGSPNIHNITFYQYDLDYTGAYTGGIQYRLDYLRLMVPDTMILTYYTTYKGKSAGGTSLVDFTATTDTFLFSSFDVGIRNLIALYAAIMINPTILVDDKSVKEQYLFWSKTLGHKYPRKRINNLIGIPQTSKASE